MRLALTYRNTLLLGIAGLVAFSASSTSRPRAQSSAIPTTSPAFEVASVKPNTSGAPASSSLAQPGGRYTATNATLRMLMRTAYAVHGDQIVGGPSWTNADRFDVIGKAEGNPPTTAFRDQARLMLRHLLAERFRLTLHHEIRELPI
jgi:uncharacterized protein (TIGR03435 family)